VKEQVGKINGIIMFQSIAAVVEVVVVQSSMMVDRFVNNLSPLSSVFGRPQQTMSF